MHRHAGLSPTRSCGWSCPRWSGGTRPATPTPPSRVSGSRVSMRIVQLYANPSRHLRHRTAPARRGGPRRARRRQVRRPRPRARRQRSAASPTARPRGQGVACRCGLPCGAWRSALSGGGRRAATGGGPKRVAVAGGAAQKAGPTAQTAPPSSLPPPPRPTPNPTAPQHDQVCGDDAGGGARAKALPGHDLHRAGEGRGRGKGAQAGGGAEPRPVPRWEARRRPPAALAGPAWGLHSRTAPRRPAVSEGRGPWPAATRLTRAAAAVNPHPQVDFPEARLAFLTSSVGTFVPEDEAWCAPFRRAPRAFACPAAYDAKRSPGGRRRPARGRA